MPRTILYSEMGGTRKRWLDSVREDLWTMPVRNRREKAKDRSEWSRIVRGAKVHVGM